MEREREGDRKKGGREGRQTVKDTKNHNRNNISAGESEIPQEINPGNPQPLPQ